MLNIINKLTRYKALLSCTECSAEYVRDYYTAKKSRIGHLCDGCSNPSLHEISQDMLHKFYSYDPNSGVMTYRLPTRQHKVGDIVGFKHSGGYIGFSHDNKQYLLHRIIWLYMTGEFPEQVDHIDHDRTNNKWDNLRDVDNTTNSKNCSISTNSSTGVNGVSKIKATGKFRVYINDNRKQIHIGVFDSLEEAKAARAKANLEYHFNENHGQ